MDDERHDSLPMGFRAAIRRWVLWFAALSAFWAVELYLLGGFTLQIGSFRLSSRAARNPLVLAFVATAAAWALTPAADRRRWLAQLSLGKVGSIPVAQPPVSPIYSRKAQLCAWSAAGLLASAVVYIGLTWGALVAGGSDSFGYLSQARLWSAGNLKIEEPLLENPPGGNPKETLVPLGYRLGPGRDRIVPIYAPGLPMAMAVAAWVGGPEAIFYVLPFLAGVATLATFALGSTLFGWPVGLAAAVLLATSPAFVFQLTHAPMSDIPATAWWAASLALVVRDGRLPPAIAGLVAGAAILTRPNLIGLALVPFAFLMWQVHREQWSPLSCARLAWFAGGLIPGVVAISGLNAYWYGSPFESGYGPLAGTFFSWSHLLPNATHFSSWLWQTQGPLVLASLALPFLWWEERRRGVSAGTPSRHAFMSAAFVGMTCLSYVFYLPLDDWWNLRFLLPAFPPLLVLTSAAFFALGRISPPSLRRWVAPLMIFFMAQHAIEFSRMTRAYDSADERRFATMGRFLAESTPGRAVFLTMLHSGSARFYSNRMTLRWDVIPATRLDMTIRDLQQRGYVPYILLDRTELKDFSARFRVTDRLSGLDGMPLATIDGVSLYDPLAARP